MARLFIKNWREFQHYKDRNPQWIKLHKKFLDDFEFHRLPLASRALAPMIWLLASESNDGSIEYDLAMIAFRVRASATEIESALKPLITAEFVFMVQDASSPLAECKQDACLEKRREEKKTLLSNEQPFDVNPVPHSNGNGKPEKANEAEAQGVREVWNYYLAAVDRKESIYEFTPLRKRKGLSRLRECLRKTGGDYPKAVEFMKLCVNAMCASDHHMGRSASANGKRYIEWEKNLFPDQNKLESWLMANDEAQ